MKTTKEKVLEYLKVNNRAYVSGQEIADSLYMTRASVWKAIKALQNEGYEIDGVSNRGYRLIISADSLNKSAIDKIVSANGIELETYLFEETESTNDRAKELAEAGKRSLVVISDYQSKGRGRRGRTFYSPKGAGLYMSFLMDTGIEAAKAAKLTAMAAVAVCRAIDRILEEISSNRGNTADSEVFGNPKIKWVNDIYLGDKKICGILTEGFSSLEEGNASNVIVGIGINIYQPKDGFPEEIKKTAGVLLPDGYSENDLRNRLCAYVILELIGLHNSNNTSFIEEYRKRSMLIGNYVRINQFNENQNNKYAKVLGIDDECRLLVEYDDKKIEYLSSGEVSVVKY